MIQIGATPATIDTPIEHLMACHRRIEQRLDTLVEAAAHLAGSPADAAAAIERSFRFFETSGAMHTADEEESLFPRLRPLLSASETAFVDSLECEHREAELVYQEVKKGAAAAVAEPAPPAIAAYKALAARLRDIYRRHIESEDKILTALAKRSLSPSQIEQIADEMKARRGAPQ